ncbi:MAG: hypothetical protein KatS3mg030_522 [Saprospiraceae bacterium]|nr:MAG: hypothetical protein KatS3mg030_522 [Saprospiraceae bacterium]
MRARKYLGMLLGVGLLFGLYRKFLAGVHTLGPGHAGVILLLLLLLGGIVLMVYRVLNE